MKRTFRHHTAQIDEFLIIIGSMKSGTSTLFKCLGQHPQIAACSQKEPDFFLRPTFTEEDLAHYRRLWAWNPDVHRFALEASPTYTSRDLARCNPAKSMRKANIPARFIYILRDPIRRIESQINHSLDLGWDRPPLQWMSYDPESVEVDIRVICASLYASQALQYIQRFGRDRMLMIKFEEMMEQPNRILSKIARFLGMDDGGFEELRFGVSNSSWQRSVALPSRMRRALKNPLVGRLAKLPPSPVKDAVRALFAKPRQSVRLTDRQRAYVLGIIGEDMTRLREELQFDTSGWTLE